ncbi:hypothetical protein ACFX12_003055 [Malus domestica]
MTLSLAGGSVEADREGGLGGFVGLKERERQRGCREVWESGGFDGGVWRQKRELKVGLPETFIKGSLFTRVLEVCAEVEKPAFQSCILLLLFFGFFSPKTVKKAEAGSLPNTKMTHSFF